MRPSFTLQYYFEHNIQIIQWPLYFNIKFKFSSLFFLFFHLKSLDPSTHSFYIKFHSFSSLSLSFNVEQFLNNDDDGRQQCKRNVDDKAEEGDDE